jgi:hypothetical protein
MTGQTPIGSLETASASNGKLSPEFSTIVRLQEQLSKGGLFSSDAKNALAVLAALMDGINLPQIDAIALATMTGRLSAARKTRDIEAVNQAWVPALVMDAGARTDHVLSDVAPAMTLGAIPVVPSVTPNQAIAPYIMQEVDGTLSKWPDGNILTLTPVSDSSTGDGTAETNSSTFLYLAKIYPHF